VDWINLAQVGGKWQAVVKIAMNLRVPQNSGDLLTSTEALSF